ncbi:MAG: phosphonoacetate hydrolase [Pseudomonadota bacterium]
MELPSFELNGVNYVRPARPIVIVCIDGGDPSYLQVALEADAVPTMARFMRDGFYTIANGSMPSFTCPNNMSIVTGSEPAVHGISGNFYLDPDSREPVVMTGPELLRSSTILAGYSELGVRVVTITAKDKLRRQLQHGIAIEKGHISFSSQCADSCTMAENGIEHVTKLVGKPEPDMYSAELSLFVLDAGIRLLESPEPTVMYLSLTDYVQHKHAPEEPEAIAFYRALDERFAELEARGAVLGITADHGMSDKADTDGTPNVIWLQDILDEALGTGRSQVICPITDPFVAHHGALGGLVRVYLTKPSDQDQAIASLRDVPGIESVLTRDAAARSFHQPEDREGDLFVTSTESHCLGSSAKDHDLEGLAGHRLRTHGGVSETFVPFIVSRPLKPDYWRRAAGQRLRSHQLFDFTINGTR